MTLVNPYAGDPDREPVWEQGYEAGFAEPEVDHTPPLEAEQLDVFAEGEKTGRDDRRAEPSTQDPFPAAATPDFSRFEAAPDGVLIPVPDEAPQGNPIHDDATVTVNPLTATGYYVVIYNGPPERQSEFGEHLAELLQETAISQLEHMLAHQVASSAAKAAIKFGGLFVSVAISVFTPSPVLKESRFRGYLDDGTAVAYVVLDPQ